MEDSTEGGRLIPEQVWDATTFPRWNCFAANLRVRPVRWCGHIRSTSNCDDRCATAKSSTSRRRPVQRYQVEGTKSSLLRMAIQQQMPHHSPGKEAAPAVVLAGHSALELRWMADRAGYKHARPARSLRRRPALCLAGGGPRDCFHLLLAPGTTLGRRELHRSRGVAGVWVVWVFDCVGRDTLVRRLVTWTFAAKSPVQSSQN